MKTTNTGLSLVSQFTSAFNGALSSTAVKLADPLVHDIADLILDLGKSYFIISI